jgi:CRISPR-associated endonuclease Cas3-HD
VLAWLWRRLHGLEVVAAATPRRLVYVLPQGSLVEPVAAQAAEWLTRLGLIDQVGLHIVPGGPDSGGVRWRRDMHCPAIVIGCADYLVSKALNRAVGTSPAIYSIDFALVTNGAQWVFDDIARCERSAATLGQLASAAAGRTAEPFAVTACAAPPARVLRADPVDFVAATHRPGARTEVVLDSVAAAVALYSALAGSAVPCILIHSRFRGRERKALAETIAGDPGDSGQIVITVALARAASTPVRLPSGPGLFDATVPVAEFLDDPDALEAQLIWAVWNSDGPPPEDARLPADEWRCRAPLALVDALAARVPVWRFDRAVGWSALSPEQPARLGEVLLVAAADGGYDPVLGFDPAIRAVVADSPRVDAAPTSTEAGCWVSLRQHSEETRDQAAALLAAIRPGLPATAIRAVECAAYLHDVGKAHPIWQDALCALAVPDDRERIEAGRPWAKSGQEAPLEFAGDVTFRHELASLLLIDGPLHGLVDEAADRDLVRYLVLAHHGRLRLRVRDDDQVNSVNSAMLYGLEHGATVSIPPVLDQPRMKLTIDLAQFGDPTAVWTSTVLGLLDRYGPFALAYLESLVRIADWRSSGREPLP